jgi:hypothetical protein
VTNAVSRMQIASIGNDSASVEVPGAPPLGPLPGSLGVYVPVALDHLTGAISAAAPDPSAREIRWSSCQPPDRR